MLFGSDGEGEGAADVFHQIRVPEYGGCDY